MSLAARVARGCCALQRRGTNANAVAASARALTFSLLSSQPFPRWRSHQLSLRRLEAVLERPLATSCRSDSGQSNNRGGVAESSSSSNSAASGNEIHDGDGVKPRPPPPPLPKKQRRVRLDEAASLVAGASVSRTVIQSWIARGKVFVDGVPITKAGHSVSPKSVVEVRAAEERFVCRGGLKLDAALEQFGIDVRGMRAIDCGLSTGGFADRLLQGGVEAVLGVDVGYGEIFVFYIFFFLILSRALPLSLSLPLARPPLQTYRSKEGPSSLSPPAVPLYHFLTSSSVSSPFKKMKKTKKTLNQKNRPSRGEDPERPPLVLAREDKRPESRAFYAPRRCPQELRYRDAGRQLHIGAQGEKCVLFFFFSFLARIFLTFLLSRLINNIYDKQTRSSRPSPRSWKTRPSSSSSSSRSSRPGRAASAPAGSCGTRGCGEKSWSRCARRCPRRRGSRSRSLTTLLVREEKSETKAKAKRAPPPPPPPLPRLLLTTATAEAEANNSLLLLLLRGSCSRARWSPPFAALRQATLSTWRTSSGGSGGRPEGVEVEARTEARERERERSGFFWKKRRRRHCWKN